MANDNISTQQNTTSTFSPTANTITQLTESEDVTIKRPANHNEISIMENDWKQIRRKVNKLQISKHFNIPDIILGSDNSEANSVHLNDLNDLLDQADSSNS